MNFICLEDWYMQQNTGWHKYVFVLYHTGTQGIARSFGFAIAHSAFLSRTVYVLFPA